MSRILCSKLDYRAVKIFLWPVFFPWFVTGYWSGSQLCSHMCVNVFLYLWLYWVQSCCSEGFHAVRALNQSYPHQGVGQIWKCHCTPLGWLLYWNIVRIHVTCFDWCTVCSPSGFLWKTSTRETSVFVGTKCQQSPSNPCRLKFSKHPSWQMLWVLCSEMFAFHSPIEEGKMLCQVLLVKERAQFRFLMCIQFLFLWGF